MAASLLLGVCCCSSPAAGGVFCVRITSGRVSAFPPAVGICSACCGLCAASLIGAGAASLLGCWGHSEGPRAVGRAFSDPPGAAVGRLRGGPACYPRRGRKKSSPFLKSVRTEFSRRFWGPTLNLRRLETTILKLRRLKKLKISPYARTRRSLEKSPKKSAALETGRG